MAKVVLHVGAHKTGTTFVQNLFHLNRVRLAQAGVHYPDIGPNTAHHALAGLWLDLPDVPDRFYGRAGPEGLWQRLIAQYADAEGTLFLSAENFSRCHPQEVDMEDLARRLSVFEEVKILYTLRPQTELVQSLWLQLAKSGRALAIHAYARAAIETRRALGVRIDHGSVYTALRRGFAPEQIHLLDYNQIRQAPGGLGQVFLDLLGCGLSATELRQPDREEANISPDPLAFWIASEVAGGQNPDPDLVAQVASALSGLGRPGTLLARHEYQKLRNRYAESNAALVEQVQSVQPGFSFLQPDTPGDLIYRNEIPGQAWLEIARGLYKNDAERPSLGRVLPLGRRLRKT